MTRFTRLPLAMVLVLAQFSWAAPASAAPGKKSGPPAARKKAPQVKHGVPSLAPGELWVASIPAGLEVRIGENPISGKVVGRTPVVVDAADVGAFVTVVLLKEEYGADLPHQIDLGDFTAKTTHSAVHQVAGKEEDWLRAITYEVKLPARPTVIALFQPRSLPLSRAARLFPPGSNFVFSDAAVSKRLVEKGVTASNVTEGLALLHRGGKLLLPAQGNWVVAEVTAPGVVEVRDLASALSQPGRAP